MPRVLVVEKSPLVATDIFETVQEEFPHLDVLTVNSIEAAEAALLQADLVDFCIVSGSTTRERLVRLADALDGHRIGTITISDDETVRAVFDPRTVHISSPFTSDMLIEALRQVSRGAGRPEPL